MLGKKNRGSVRQKPGGCYFNQHFEKISPLDDWLEIRPTEGGWLSHHTLVLLTLTSEPPFLSVYMDVKVHVMHLEFYFTIF